MLFDSPLSDDAFALSCLKGAEKAKAESGMGLFVCISGSDSESAQLLDQLAASERYGLIISIGASQSANVTQNAVKYPDQKFALVDGDIADKSNVSSLLVKDQESAFLAGAMAALLSKSGIIGFIGGVDLPPIERFLAGYRSGALYINPDCQVLVDYSGTWLNDGKTRSLALQQADKGAEVVFGAAGAGSLGVIQAAREKGLYAIGVDTDQSSLAPQNIPASTLKYTDVSVYNAIVNFLSGNFQAGIAAGGLKEGTVGLAINESLPAVTATIKAKISEIEGKIIAGEISIPEQ
jgi:basic membrane protein A